MLLVLEVLIGVAVFAGACITPLGIALWTPIGYYVGAATVLLLAVGGWIDSTRTGRVTVPHSWY
jgi:hypothetical protein